MLSDTSPMPFGAHRDKPMAKVPASYLDWMSSVPDLLSKYTEVASYIKRCRVAIDDDLHKAGNIPHRFRTRLT